MAVIEVLPRSVKPMTNLRTQSAAGSSFRILKHTILPIPRSSERAAQMYTIGE